MNAINCGAKTPLPEIVSIIMTIEMLSYNFHINGIAELALPNKHRTQATMTMYNRFQWFGQRFGPLIIPQNWYIARCQAERNANGNWIKCKSNINMNKMLPLNKSTINVFILQFFCRVSFFESPKRNAGERTNEKKGWKFDLNNGCFWTIRFS